MPHVIVKIWPGPSEKQKARCADKIVEALVASIGTGEESISVAIEEISADKWMAKVYWPEIDANMAALYKKPGYGPFWPRQRLSLSAPLGKRSPDADEVSSTPPCLR